MLEEALESPKISSEPDEVLAVASTMTDELRTLILSSEVFRPIVVDGPNRRKQMLMSCGGLFARLNRLHCQRSQLQLEQQLRLEHIEKQVNRTTQELKQQFIVVLQKEAKARLYDLERLLDDGEWDRAYLRDEFEIEMRNRERLEEVVKALGSHLDEELAEKLARLDNRLRILCQPGPFIWSEALRAIYPASRYWYLYVAPLI